MLSTFKHGTAPRAETLHPLVCNWSAAAGCDMASGLGTVNAADFVPEPVAEVNSLEPEPGAEAASLGGGVELADLLPTFDGGGSSRSPTISSLIASHCACAFEEGTHK
jgi:hypothetical protein